MGDRAPFFLFGFSAALGLTWSILLAISGPWPPAPAICLQTILDIGHRVALLLLFALLASARWDGNRARYPACLAISVIVLGVLDGLCPLVAALPEAATCCPLTFSQSPVLGLLALGLIRDKKAMVLFSLAYLTALASLKLVPAAYMLLDPSPSTPFLAIVSDGLIYIIAPLWLCITLLDRGRALGLPPREILMEGRLKAKSFVRIVFCDFIFLLTILISITLAPWRGPLLICLNLSVFTLFRALFLVPATKGRIKDRGIPAETIILSALPFMGTIVNLLLLLPERRKDECRGKPSPRSI